MNNSQFMLREIESWRRSELIGADTAGALRARYGRGKSANALVLVFSILGSLLIGAGIILICARNWYFFPLQIRVGIAFLPLAISQCAAVYALAVKRGSPAWRESAALLVTASVFASVAIVGQAFHIPNDLGAYVLLCGLLSLPMVYILDAVSPLAVYFWAIAQWAVPLGTEAAAASMLGLFVLGAAYIFVKRKDAGARMNYATGLTAAAGFVMLIIAGIVFDYKMDVLTLGFFIILMAYEGFPERRLAIFKNFGAVGGIVLTAVMTLDDLWAREAVDVSNFGFILMALMFSAGICLSVFQLRRNKSSFLFTAPFAFLILLRVIWILFNLHMAGFAFVFSFVSSAIMFGVGVGLVHNGVKNASLPKVNLGMVTVCGLIMIKFFDSGMDILWRGIAFLLLGAAFLFVNARIVRHRKKRASPDPAGDAEGGAA